MLRLIQSKFPTARQPNSGLDSPFGFSDRRAAYASGFQRPDHRTEIIAHQVKLVIDRFSHSVQKQINRVIFYLDGFAFPFRWLNRSHPAFGRDSHDVVDLVENA
jgi:hypothetical protein